MDESKIWSLFDENRESVAALKVKLAENCIKYNIYCAEKPLFTTNFIKA